jgi:hypothetical protein
MSNTVRAHGHAIYFLSTFLPPKGSKRTNSIPSNFAYSRLVMDLAFPWKANRFHLGAPSATYDR